MEQVAIEEPATLTELIAELDERGVKHEGKPMECPVHIWACRHSSPNREANKEIDTVAYCPVCGNPYCPECGNHHVLQLSRITGYLSDVSGWNSAKKQELKDRKRYTVGGEPE